MSESEHIDGITIGFVAIQGHIARIPKAYHEFAQPYIKVERSAYRRVGLKPRKPGGNRLAGAFRGFRAFADEKPSTSGHAFCRTFSDNQSWHSGRSVSASEPQSLNQAVISSPVRCRPVSR